LVLSTRACAVVVLAVVALVVVLVVVVVVILVVVIVVATCEYGKEISGSTKMREIS
jgi:hypothetical protein